MCAHMLTARVCIHLTLDGFPTNLVIIYYRSPEVTWAISFVYERMC
jgi:hypothetical protein